MGWEIEKWFVTQYILDFCVSFLACVVSVSTLLQSAHIAVLFIVIDLPGFFPQLLVPRAQNMDAHPKKCAIDTKK